MTPEREREIRAMHAFRQCYYVGRCNSSRCPEHGGEAVAMADLLAEVDRLRAARDDAAGLASLLLGVVARLRQDVTAADSLAVIDGLLHDVPPRLAALTVDFSPAFTGTSATSRK